MMETASYRQQLLLKASEAQKRRNAEQLALAKRMQCETLRLRVLQWICRRLRAANTGNFPALPHLNLYDFPPVPAGASWPTNMPLRRRFFRWLCRANNNAVIHRNRQSRQPPLTTDH